MQPIYGDILSYLFPKMSYFPSSHLALPSMTHSLWLFPNLPPGDSFPCSQMTLPSIPHSLWLFPNLPPGGDSFPYSQMALPSISHSLWLFPTLPPAGEISLLTVDTDGNFFTSSMLATLTPQREISPLNVANGGIFSLHNGGNTDFSYLAPEGRG